MSMASKFSIRANREDLDERVVMFRDASLSTWEWDAGGFVDIQLSWEEVVELQRLIDTWRHRRWAEMGTANG